MTRTRMFVIVSTVALLVVVGLVLWRQAQLEREARELAAEREKLAAEVAELKLRSSMLREWRSLAERDEFFLVSSPEGLELRIQNRVIRRFEVRAESRAALRGRYQLQRMEPEALFWDDLVIFPLDFAQMEGSPGWCPEGVRGCLYVRKEDFAVLSRLKPGTVLLILPY